MFVLNTNLKPKSVILDHQIVTVDIVYDKITVASVVIRVFSCARVKQLKTYSM